MYCISHGLSSGFNLGTSVSKRACSTEGAGAVMVCRDTSLSLASPKNWAPAFREPIRPQELEA